MSAHTLSKVYEHRDVEPRWYARWEEAGHFAADVESDKPPYTIVIPPPNVTGSLHMGHALTLTIQDILIRWKRMAGFNALWLPGTDHAGIATQMVVERELAKEGLSRFDLGRERFVAKVWEWKAFYHDRITRQSKALGCSVDWDRERFTLDEGLSRAVREVFVRLHEEGLIYRDDRLVNWSPGCQTVISDLEVVYEDRPSSLWYIAYPITDSDERIVVATTRPETMLGDTGVAVHSQDARYQHLVGRTAELPLVGRRIPIVSDDILVDPEFGTGAVKITPAHDFNDFDTGKRHGLEMISVLDRDARLNENAPEKYRGMDRFEARTAIVADLEALGLMVKIEDYALTVGTCQRSGVVVEPMLSKQWYVRAAPLAKPAADAVRDGRTRIVPRSWEKTYFHWMDNIRDWCISRQLWWGHQIPAWHCDDCGEVTVSREDATACHACGGARLTRDPDVLDTWFSSALWPFSTLGWPDESRDVEVFYPTSVMETGFDILFFWVARMMMMGIHFMGEVPFETVFLHAMVRDASGQKMSKTKGNVIDPLDVSRDLGADSLRYTLASLAGQGRDIKLSLKAVESNRNFVNKIWNACRFALLNLEDYDPTAPAPAELGRIDRWILSRLDRAVERVTGALEGFTINEAAQALYTFFWSELCDWYIELSKPLLYDEAAGERRRATQWTLVGVLDASLRLLHPFIPFASEEIWQQLPHGPDRPEALIIADFPRVGDAPRDAEAEADVERLMAVITGVRNIRGELSIPPSKAVPAVLRAPSEADLSALDAEREVLRRLARLESVSFQVGGERPKGAAMQLAGAIEVYVPLAGLIDFAGELSRLDKAIGKAAKSAEGVAKKLANPKFLANAPDAIVEKEREKQTALEGQLEKLRHGRETIAALAEDQ